MRIAKAKQFEKQYRKFPLRTIRQFADRITIFLADKNHPLLNVHSLKGAYTGLWSFNVNADTRVIFDDSYDDIFLLVAIGTHSQLYK